MLGPVWASSDDDVELKVCVARLSRRERAWMCEGHYVPPHRHSQISNHSSQRRHER